MDVHPVAPLMRGRLLFQSRVYVALTVFSLGFLAYVAARAPLWNPIMAGARAQLASGQLALVAPAWSCTDRPHTCSTTVAGNELVVTVSAIGSWPMVCNARYLGERVACAPRAWYAPQLKPFFELGVLPGVSFGGAVLEGPWRLLDLGLLGESGPLHAYAGLVCFLLVALGAGTTIRRGGWWWIPRVALGAFAFVSLNAAWFLACVRWGYID